MRRKRPEIPEAVACLSRSFKPTCTCTQGLVCGCACGWLHVAEHGHFGVPCSSPSSLLQLQCLPNFGLQQRKSQIRQHHHHCQMGMWLGQSFFDFLDILQLESLQALEGSGECRELHRRQRLISPPLWLLNCLLKVDESVLHHNRVK